MKAQPKPKSPKTKRTGRKSCGTGPVFETRAALGLTQQELAAQVGCSVVTIKRCEKRGTLPQSQAAQGNLKRLKKITPLFG